MDGTATWVKITPGVKGLNYFDRDKYGDALNSLGLTSTKSGHNFNPIIGLLMDSKGYIRDVIG